MRSVIDSYFLRSILRQPPKKKRKKSRWYDIAYAHITHLIIPVWAIYSVTGLYCFDKDIGWTKLFSGKRDDVTTRYRSYTISGSVQTAKSWHTNLDYTWHMNNFRSICSAYLFHGIYIDKMSNYSENFNYVPRD